MQGELYQYRLTRELAKKYSHTTYLASPIHESESDVVLIAFNPSLSFAFPRECENFLQKAQHIKELEHSHLLPILDMGIEEEQPFAVREYLPNGSLRSRLKKISPDHLELGEALTIVSQIGQALAYAHEHHIFHGNIRPENVLFDAHDQVFLTDFHLMSRKDALIRDQTTEEYAFCYMAPEQFTGSITEKSDQYALGCLAYELITGYVPFAAQTLASMIGHQNSSQPQAFSERVADVPPSLEAAVLKALAKDPAERFADFSLFLEVVQSVLLLPPTFPLGPSAASRKRIAASRRTRLPPNARTFVSSLHEVAVSPSSALEGPKAMGLSHMEQYLIEPMGVPVAAEASVETLEDQISQQPLTRQIPEEQVDDRWLNDLFEEQESHDLSATGSVSLELEQYESGKEKKNEVIVSLLNERDRRLKRRILHDRRVLLGLVFLCFVIVASGAYAAFSLARTGKPDQSVRPTQVVNQVLVSAQRAISPTQPATAIASAQPTSRTSTIPTVIPTPTPSPVVHQILSIDDSVQGTGLNQFNYVGNGWGHCGSCLPQAYGGSNSWDNTINDYLTVSFKGIQLKFYTVVDPLNHGIEAVSLDGGSETTVGSYGPTEESYLLWTSPMVPEGLHIFKLRVQGSANNPIGPHDYSIVDRVNILS